MSIRNTNEYKLLFEACKKLPKTKGNYLVNDFISNLLLTVLDYQLHNKIVSKAYNYYKNNLYDKIRTISDLKSFLEKYPNNKYGNTEAAKALWNYKYWNRIKQLRDLIYFFESICVTDQQALKEWCHNSQFDVDFEGKIKGLGYAVYKWLQIRLGVETIKPDLHIKRFLKDVTGKNYNDDEAVSTLECVANDLGWKIFKLDWSIWEYQRGGVGEI